MADVVYVSEQRVLEEAGLYQRQLAEVATGTMNGTNTSFTVTHKPLADSNYDDTIDDTDVVVYVDGVVAQVVSVDDVAGQVTLLTAPGLGEEVTIDYSYSPVPTTLVDEVIEEAQDWIDTELAQIVTTPFTTVPKRVRSIARMFAAGLLLTGDYDFQQNEGGSTAGGAKLTRATEWLTAYRARLFDNGSDVGTQVVPRSSVDRRIFQERDQVTQEFGVPTDENFRLSGDL